MMKRQDIKRRPLSDTTINSLEVEDKIYREADGHGLYLHVHPKGTKTWVRRYKKPNGKWAWKVLGKYPQMKGAEARKANFDAIDSCEERQVLSFSAVAEEWLSFKINTGRADSAARQIRLYFDKDIFPEVGSIAIDKVTRQDCSRIQSNMESRGVRSITSKVRVWLNGIFRYAIAKGYCEINPASELTMVALPSKEKNYPSLKENEIGDFLNAINESPSYEIAKNAFMMLFYTAARPGMVRNAEWSEVDTKKRVWVIPAAKMKSRRDHVIPLQSQVIELLRFISTRTGEGRYIFPGSRDNAVISDATLNKLITISGYKGRITSHGVRHTMSTLLNEHQWPSDLVETQLAHMVKGVAGVYNQAEYLEKRRIMMQWYADYIDALKVGISPEMAVKFKQRVADAR